MSFKDLFSQQASGYARYRPHYPAPLFSWLVGLVPEHRLAVDVGSGNGQAAAALAPHFERVIAIEPSGSQLAHAAEVPNIDYRKAAAEETGLDAGVADLLVSAQALHWFDHDAFFAEVGRVVRPRGALVVWCYGLTRVTPEIDDILLELYEKELGSYWDPARRLVENGYRSIEVPFAEIETPPFDMQISWSLDQIVGYLGTWSALRAYLEKHPGDNPLERIYPRLERAWGAGATRTVSWPLGLRAFRI